ncbi:unnamed protein product [Prunus armeniaca]|uniref:Uncharacterized protein n=1 Tax=Prunus armeniaca TaxID=36596 RepID=A0A6J5U7B6_PRUAR|nr:unnamed protein product [Prunus armeniaca]
MSGMESGSGSIMYPDGTAFVVQEAAKICGSHVFGSVQGGEERVRPLQRGYDVQSNACGGLTSPVLLQIIITNSSK